MAVDGMNIASIYPPCSLSVCIGRVLLATPHPQVNVELKLTECVARAINIASQHCMGGWGSGIRKI